MRLNKEIESSTSGSIDPARCLSRRIQRAFKRAGLPQLNFAFSLEVTQDERKELHVHGAIDLGGNDLRAVKSALRQAGGLISGRAGARQLQIKAFDMGRGGPSGWAKYPTKAARRTQQVIQHHRLIFIGQDLRQLARHAWETRRKQHILN